MTSIVPISRQRHGDKHWKRFSSYTFAANDALAPLALAELSKAATALPIAFIEQDDRFIPAALMGFRAGQNLLVSAAGQWLGRYIPAAYRSYPFQLVKADNGQQVLCVDESSGLISDGVEGDCLFEPDGQPNPGVLEILSFLEQTNASREAVLGISELLQRHQLIQPWPLTVQGASGKQHIGGLFQIDERMLNSIAAEALAELRDSGALLVSYLQLLSMQQLGELANLAKQTEPSGTAADGQIPQGETFSFGNLF